MDNDNDDVNWGLALDALHIYAFLKHKNCDNCKAGIH